MRRLRALAATALACACASGALWAHVRLHHSGNGHQLYWSSPSNIAVVIQAAGSDDLGDGSHFTALRNAIAEWHRDTGTDARLTEIVAASAQARTDWAADDIHLILFDEDDSSGYFPAGSGTVALTPVWFMGDGRITDADILFNGSGFAFTTSGEPDAFDVQDVAVHELGHLLGLDHSGWAGASLYPYVSPHDVLHRSVSRDDQHGLRDAYPSIAHASIYGVVRRTSDSSAVAGAHVCAVDAHGRTSAGTLSSSAGAFRLEGLDPGTYVLYATPLDFPVSSANLTPGHAVQTDFGSTFGVATAVAAGQNVVYGDLLVAADTGLSLGRNYDTLPERTVAGVLGSHSLHGSGLVVGSTLACSDPSVHVHPIAWMTTQVVFEATSLAGAAPGHVDLIVTNPAGERSILPAALEITPPDPGIASVAPSVGSDLGGTSVVIHGSNFRSGACVVIGTRIYADGSAGGCTVVSDSLITLTTSPHALGAFDVVVIDSTGVEGRAQSGFTFSAVPAISSVFPSGGVAFGGTQVVIRGTGLAPGLMVRIDGVDQPNVSVEDPTRATLLTSPGVAGGPYMLELENPGGAIATAAFSYSLLADPALNVVAPAVGPRSGGTMVTLMGSDFTPQSEVIFGADPDTGQGGIEAASVSFIDAQTLSVTTPSHAAGAASVLVRTPGTGQAIVLSNAFTFTGSGGGGGCASVARSLSSDAPWSGRDALAGAGWILFALAALALQQRTHRRTAAAAR